MAFYHSDRDPDYNRGIFVSSWIEVHVVLVYVWTLLQSSLGQEAPFHVQTLREGYDGPYATFYQQTVPLQKKIDLKA